MVGFFPKYALIMVICADVYLPTFNHLVVIVYSKLAGKYHSPMCTIGYQKWCCGKGKPH